MMKMKAKVLLATTLVFIAATVCTANVVLPDVISEAMVIQRDRPVPIWGRADAGEVVTVRFAGQSKHATTGGDGKGQLRLDTLHANPTPATMIISGKNTIELKHILVGEVWVVAAQSNMHGWLSQTANGEQASPTATHA